jgi:hypothetical protein
VQSASPPLWQVFTVKWAALRLELLEKRTHARHSVSSQLVKYNIIGATIFMTFRTQIFFFLPDLFFIEKKGIGSFYNKLCNWVKQDIQNF